VARPAGRGLIEAERTPMQRGWCKWLRRLFLALLQLGIAASQSGPSGAQSSPQAAAGLTETIGGLTELRSIAGVLAVTLIAAEGKVRVGDLELDGATYNGLYAGPVLRVLPGDLLRIRLVNHLSQPTNLHFHGIFTSPLGNSDNVHLAIAPGQSFAYEVRIPVTQPPGLYWYHSHLHGLSEHQVMAGLSGTLVVDPPALPQALPSGRAERLFVLKDMTFDDDTGNPRIDEELHGVVQSIDGNLDTSETMRAGETQLWRFTNQSANLPFHIALQGHRFRIIAQDGEPTIDERMVDMLDIMPAARVDVQVEGGAPGRYEVLSKGTMTGTGAARRPDRVLGHLDVAGIAPVPAAAVPAATVTVGTQPPGLLPTPPDLRAAAIDARRTIAFTETTTLKAGAQKFYINGRIFDMNRVDIRVPLGNVEEWTLRNDSDDLHVFHIHQLSFQVVEINGVPVPFNGRVDTVRVPERGEVKLRMAFTDAVIVGQFVIHCHVLQHEDKGMMAMMEVYDPRTPMLLDWCRRLYLHLWWWAHGVPWSLCGLSSA
jgi:FtsP/CotA-like multicopper oxidase with cupredoxin domain